MDAISYSYADKQAKRIKKFIENPDSTSGVVTVPSTIATGETITVPAGRTAILPDVVIEGDLLVEGTVFIPTGTTYTQETLKTEAISNVAGSTVVDVTDIVSRVGNQDVGGIKNFTSSPTVPTPTAGDNSTKVATTAFATSQDLGVGQTWQNVVGSRAIGTTYTNTTGKPIFVAITTNGASSGLSASLQIADITVAISQQSVSSNVALSVFGIVPNGSTYKCNSTQTSIIYWSELR